MHTKSFYIHTLGCRVNQAQSDELAVKLSASGWIQTDTPKDADICIVNTCTVTSEADKKSRKMVRWLKRQSDANVYVCGCSVKMNPDIYSELGAKISLKQLGLSANKEQFKLNRGLQQSKNETVDAVKDATKANRVKSQQQKVKRHIEINYDENTRSKALKKQGVATQSNNSTDKSIRLHSRRGVIIQNGCNNACTYCIVHTARGPAKSKPADKILDECITLAKEGVHEIILTGIDLGAWNGVGDNNAILHQSTKTLSQLLKLLLSNTSDDVRFRLSSIEPTSINAELIDMLAKSSGRLCRYLHIPLQSGSTKVLQEMHRNYTAQEYKKLIDTLRIACPKIALSTDIIVGFPGETEQDFLETYKLAKHAKFMKLHIFPYSMREGTPAAKRTDQIDPITKANRARRLKELNDELAARDLAVRHGTTEGVIIETKIEENTNKKSFLCTGTTESFHTIKFTSNKKEGSLINTII